MDIVSPLLTDLYQLTMADAYLSDGMTQTAVFEFFVRTLPPRRGFLVAAGLAQALDFLENLRFSPEDLDWLRSTGRFSAALIDYFAGLRFTGDIHAMPEGTIFFPNEPILRVTAPLPVAQLVETRLINILNFESLIASKAARVTLAARGKQLVDFGLRRAHGSEAGLLAARASYIAGMAGTATVLANKLFGIPMFGTMAHSFIEAYDDETSAFESFARARPKDVVLLIDTYDTEAAARKVVALAPRLQAADITIRGVRLDSGDLISLSRHVRQILDEGGLQNVIIFASGGLDEDQIATIVAAGAPIDGFGIGTNLTTSSDVPALECAYKLQEYAGLPRRKYSPGKTSWPGRKQVWRRLDSQGFMAGDTLSTEDDQQPGEPLLMPAMRAGRRLASNPSLTDVRARFQRDLARLPEPLRQLKPAAAYHVGVADSLIALAAATDRRVAENEGNS